MKICHLDPRKPCSIRRESPRRSRIRHGRLVGETSHEGSSLEDVRFRSLLWPSSLSNLGDYLHRVGRIDDVIMHSSGEKTVPAPMEDIVMSNRL